MRIFAEQNNGSVLVEARAAFIICKDVNSEPGSAGFVLGDTNGTDLLASTAVCAARLIQELSSGDPDTNKALTESFVEAVRDMSSKNTSQKQEGEEGPAPKEGTGDRPTEQEITHESVADDMVEVTVYAHPYMDQRGTLQVPKSLMNDPAAMTEYVNPRFWKIDFKEDDLDYSGTSYDIYMNEEELVWGAPVPDDDEDWDEDEGEDEE